eukprot:scaffold72535_cov65-Phaeocystis_antarctica.AAC.5
MPSLPAVRTSCTTTACGYSSVAQNVLNSDNPISDNGLVAVRKSIACAGGAHGFFNHGRCGGCSSFAAVPVAASEAVAVAAVIRATNSPGLGLSAHGTTSTSDEKAPDKRKARSPEAGGLNWLAERDFARPGEQLDHFPLEGLSVDSSWSVCRV